MLPDESSTPIRDCLRTSCKKKRMYEWTHADCGQDGKRERCCTILFSQMLFIRDERLDSIWSPVRWESSAHLLIRWESSQVFQRSQANAKLGSISFAGCKKLLTWTTHFTIENDLMPPRRFRLRKLISVLTFNDD